MKNIKTIAKALIITTLVSFLMLAPDFESKAASILTVGPGKMYSTPQAAFNAASSGDIIEIYADGVYYGTNAHLAITGKNNITIRGAGGRPKMIAQPGVRLTWGKALWVVDASNITIENIEFQDAACDDKNGAGIRCDPGAAGTLLIKNCYFHDNENGILTSAPTSTLNLIIESSEFSRNGYGDGQSHNMYIGRNTNFTLRYSYSHNVKRGHLVKSRATKNYIEYNRLTDETTDSNYYSNYNIDLPEGGTSYVIGNLLHQGSYSPNNCLIAYALENTNNPGKNCYIINNTVVNDASNATFFRCRNDASYAVTYKNNIITGAGTVNSGGACSWIASNNYRNTSADPGFFTDKSNYNYTLKPTATDVINKGTNPGTGDGYSLTPTKQYVHKCGYTNRTINGSAIDIGAYEY